MNEKKREMQNNKTKKYEQKKNWETHHHLANGRVEMTHDLTILTITKNYFDQRHTGAH